MHGVLQIHCRGIYRQGDCLRAKGPLFPMAPFCVSPSGSSPQLCVPVSSFQFSSQSPFPVPVPALRGRRPAVTMRGWRRQEAGERRGQRFLPARAIEHVGRYLPCPSLHHLYCTLRAEVPAPPLPRLTGRSSAGKKVRQGQAGSRASSCQISHRSVLEADQPLGLPVCPSTHFGM